MGYILNQEQITVRRYGEYRSATTGRSSLALQSTLTIWASVQGLRGSDLQVLPEGKRNSRTKKLYTETELRTADQDATPPQPADRVVLDGVEFEVFHVDLPDRTGDIYPGYRVYCSKVLE